MKGGDVKYSDKWRPGTNSKNPSYIYSLSEANALNILIPGGIQSKRNLKWFWEHLDVNAYKHLNISDWTSIEINLIDAYNKRASHAEDKHGVNVSDHETLDYDTILNDMIKGNHPHYTTDKGITLSFKDLTHLQYYYILKRAREQIKHKIKQLKQQTQTSTQAAAEPRKPRKLSMYSSFADSDENSKESSEEEINAEARANIFRSKKKTRRVLRRRPIAKSRKSKRRQKK